MGAEQRMAEDAVEPRSENVGLSVIRKTRVSNWCSPGIR